MKRYFVTGTDTDVGKTVVSALLVKKLSAYYWKPIQSGIIDIEDKDTVQKISGAPDDKILPCAYELREPLSPHDAAEIDGVRIDLDAIIMPDVEGPLVIEGAGGVFVPINEKHLMIDLIKKLDCEVIVVARSGLGTINHTLLTLKALRDEGIRIKGIILNGELNPRNKKSIEGFGAVTTLGEIPRIQNLDFSDFELNLLKV
jgi:dethiobiotin synthetase